MKMFALPKLAGGVRSELIKTDRSLTNPTHWMPVPFPGLTLSEHGALMREMDRRPYTPPPWLRMRQTAPSCERLATPASDRDPQNPLHWMAVPPPVISPGQIQARAEAFGLKHKD